jgi:soluble lytic murein transglycosylase
MRNTSIISDRPGITITAVSLLLIVLFCFGVQALAVTDIETAKVLLSGRKSLDASDYQTAVIQLTVAIDKVPQLSDYILMWRSDAYEGLGDHEKALADLRTIKTKYRQSPVIKKARLRELKIIEKNSVTESAKTYKEFVGDYPTDLDVKFAYAQLLKKTGKTAEAVRLFKELYVTASPVSDKARYELSDNDTGPEDLLKRCDNLNKAWLFASSEKCFREVMKKDAGKRLLSDTLQGLAYSLFRQKKYAEAAKLYKGLNTRFWNMRALFRAGDFNALKQELSSIKAGDDRRIASVLIAYGTKIRRDGDLEGALKIYETALTNFPSSREDILWAKGWAYHLSKDYKNAANIFGTLQASYGDEKYTYWKNRAEKLSGDNGSSEGMIRNGDSQRDFYAYISMARYKNHPEPAQKTPLRVSFVSPEAERVDLLVGLGLRDEAVLELKSLAEKGMDPSMLVYASSYLEKLGNYNTALHLISRLPYKAEYHELLYPAAYSSELDEAAAENGIDRLFVLSIMRAESRYTPDARSIAGALGLMQVMPGLAARLHRQLRIDYRNPEELYNVRTNISIGSYYLKLLLRRFGSLPYAIAAYNAGEEAVGSWLAARDYRTVDEFIEDIPYDETRNYVKKVMTTYFEYLRSAEKADMDKVCASIGKL